MPRTGNMSSVARSPKTKSRPPISDLLALLLEEGADEAFERLARLATMALRAPAGVLALMQGARLQIKSATGLPEPWASDEAQPLPHAMFRHALATSKPFLVDDVQRHPLTRDMGLGAGWEHAAYCGVPLVLGDRRVVGVLAVLDPKPRAWTDREIGFLQDLAASAAQEIESRTAYRVAATTAPDELLELLAKATDGFVAVDADWTITAANERAEALLRRPHAQLVGTSLLTAFPGVVTTAFHEELTRAFGEGATVEFEERCASLDAWFEVRAYPAADGLAIHLRDMSARRNAEEALRHSEARYRGVFQDARDPILFTTAEGTITECNRATVNVFGYTREELFRMRLRDLFADSAERERFVQDIDHFGGVTDFEARLFTKDGDRLDGAITASARRGSDGGIVGFQAIIDDRTTHKRAEEELIRTAFHDVLTGLPNRALFIDRLERVIVQSKRRPEDRFAVLFIDLDKFKLVNDTLGHVAGDELLVAVARRLESCLREEDTVARLGGDEFAILLDTIQDISDATRVAERINLELALPFRLGRREIACSASIGITLAGAGYDHADEVLRDADAAMYRAKAGGRARYEVFDTAMHERAVAQLRLEKDLRSAIDDGQFQVYYQPVIGLDNGNIAGLEALVRWQHPDRGLLLPGEFIEIAEHTGMIVPLGWFVLREACRQVRDWRDSGHGRLDALTIGVNLSPRQFFQPDLAERLERIIGETGIDPAQLRLELAELVVMQNAELAVRQLEALRERGIRICLDDFGTGYSSLQYLQQLPISALKIDRSFVETIESREASRGVVQSIIALGESLEIEAIAEGVETLEQLQQLRALGAKFAQGNLFAEPMPTREMEDMLGGEGG